MLNLVVHKETARLQNVKGKKETMAGNMTVLSCASFIRQYSLLLPVFILSHMWAVK
jgi:hypothetical protein